MGGKTTKDQEASDLETSTEETLEDVEGGLAPVSPASVTEPGPLESVSGGAAKTIYTDNEAFEPGLEDAVGGGAERNLATGNDLGEQ